MYVTDRGIEELAARRGTQTARLEWLAERLRDFVDLRPEYETAIDRLATWLARLDEDLDDLLEADRRLDGDGDDLTEADRLDGDGDGG